MKIAVGTGWDAFNTIAGKDRQDELNIHRV